jgi:septation ring formation regulator EzrA
MAEKLSKKDIYIIVIAALIVGVFLIIVLIRPTISGYAAYQAIKKTNYSLEDYGKNIEELNSQLLISETNLSSQSEFNKKIFAEFEKCSDKLSQCTANLGSLEANYSFSVQRYEETLGSLKTDFEKENEKKQQEIDSLQRQYDALAQNTANNLCCKAKVDNPTIGYYRVENNKVLCLEEGELKVNC